jgi:hypothetical protein
MFVSFPLTCILPRRKFDSAVLTDTGFVEVVCGGGGDFVIIVLNGGSTIPFWRRIMADKTNRIAERTAAAANGTNSPKSRFFLRLAWSSTLMTDSMAYY